MSKSRLFTLFALFLGGTVFFTACEPSSNSNTDGQEVAVNNDNVDNQSERAEKVKKIFYTIPSPVEMASLIKGSGAPFDKSVLNNVDNAKKYTNAKMQALNLGVYGADLSYTSMFDQNQESIYYLSAAQKLAKDLGVEDAIDHRVYQRINNNMDNRDSLLQVVSEAYWSLNGYLKEGGREEISALVIAGGWVEGLHLACKNVTPGNTELKQRIAEQKYALKDLIALLNTYGDKEVLTSVIQDLNEVQQIFNDAKTNAAKTETSKDKSGTIVIGGAKKVEMSDETLALVSAKIDAIRTKYIQ